MPDLRTLVADAARRIDGGSPRLDAEVLLGFVLGVDRARLVMDAQLVPDAGAVRAFEALVERRRAGEPVAYLIGTREFRRISLCVDSRVLIPRPETELLVEVALGLPAGVRALDVGTGSGAVALALADERPDLEVWGSDVSPGAVEVARLNAERLGLPVRFVVGDLVVGDFDAVLANLPYVRDGDALPHDVVGYEPAGALFGGPDGLEIVRRLVSGLGSVPRVALEVGEGQAPSVGSMLGAAGFDRVTRHRDLAGIERVVVGCR